MFLAFLWVMAPLTVALLGGSLFWVIASFVIGGVVVFGAMGIVSLLDDYGAPVLGPEEQEIDDAFGEIRRLQHQCLAADRGGDYDEVTRLRVQITERTERLRAKLDAGLREVKS